MNGDDHKPVAGDPTPVTGGGTAPARLLRPVPRSPVRIPTDPLDMQITQVLAIHSDLYVRFRSFDLSKMDTSSKRALLVDLNDLLGIQRL